MIGIKGPADFQLKFNRLKHDRDIFGFFLYDEGPSHEAVEKFATECSGWLDGLAKSARMYFFVPLRSQAKGKFENPSLEVGRMFKITPNQLPGIVLFAFSPNLALSSDSALLALDDSAPDPDHMEVSAGIFIPLKAELFSTDTARVEEVFRDVFSLIQECQTKSNSSEELFPLLKIRVTQLKADQVLRPMIPYVQGILVSILTTSGALVSEIIRKVLVEKGPGLLFGA